jgi:hypothetical protein
MNGGERRGTLRGQKPADRGRSPSWSYNLSMKAINVTELKANLSKYLRLASRGYTYRRQ